VVQAVYYNVDIFNSLGLSAPTTWEEFLSTSQVLQNAGYIPVANSLNNIEDSEMFMSLLPNFIGGSEGRAEYSVTNNSRCFNDRRFEQAFGAIESLKPFLPAETATMSSTESKELYISQRAAMLFGGSWDLQYFTDNSPFQWSVFAPPAPAGNTTYVVFQPDVGVGLNKDTDHPTEARAFLNWLRTKDSTNLAAKSLTGFYPLINDRPENADNIHNTEFLQLANRYPTDIRWSYTEVSDEYPKASETVRFALNDMATNRITAQEAADNLQQDLAEWYAPAQTCK
jgi:raffinose/stachyose/melibiose transport system substrate-binding protein